MSRDELVGQYPLGTLAHGQPERRAMLIPFDELTDRIAGPVGTPSRALFDARVAVLKRKEARARRLTEWMRSIPLVGEVVFVWWYSLLNEGLDGAVDSLCFSYLDDANPTARWHKWYTKEVA